MNLAEVLKKVTQDVELSTEEKEFLNNYRPEGIPKSRLDTEIARRKDAENRSQELSGAMEELKGKVESLENRDLSETEKLKKDFEKELTRLRGSLQTLSTERDSTRQELDSMKFRQSVTELAGKYNFTDQQYLEYLTAKNSVALEDPDKVKEFMDALKETSPKLFKLELRPGGGSNPGSGSGTAGFLSAKAEGDVTKMLQNAPEVLNNN
jgi:chromosome segregation ATPase